MDQSKADGQQKEQEKEQNREILREGNPRQKPFRVLPWKQRRLIYLETNSHRRNTGEEGEHNTFSQMSFQQRWVVT